MAILTVKGLTPLSTRIYEIIFRLNSKKDKQCENIPEPPPTSIKGEESNQLVESQLKVTEIESTTIDLTYTFYNKKIVSCQQKVT